MTSRNNFQDVGTKIHTHTHTHYLIFSRVNLIENNPLYMRNLTELFLPSWREEKNKEPDKFQTHYRCLSIIIKNIDAQRYRYTYIHSYEQHPVRHKNK